MATEEKPPKADEQIANIRVKQEDEEWLPKDLDGTYKEFQEFVEETDLLQPIKTEIEHLNTEATAHLAELFTAKPQTREYIKTKLTFNKGLSDENGYSDTASYSQQSGYLADCQPAAVRAAEKDSETCEAHMSEVHCKETQKYGLNPHSGCQSGEKSSTSQLYKCKDCDKEYVNRSLLSEHSKEHTGLQWNCGVCENKFATRIRARAHINEVHKIRDKTSVNKFIFEVNVPGDFSVEKNPLHSNATKIVHSKPEVETDTIHLLTTTTPYIKTELILDEEFLDDDNHLDSASYLPKDSERVVETAGEQQAVDNIAGKDYETCEVSYNTYPKEMLETHRSESHRNETYQCDLRPQSFEEQCFLTRRRIHTDNRVRKYTCEKCGFRFLQKDSLRSHMITHAKDRKRTACSLCEKSFYSRTGLLLHMRTHTGHTHNCELCGMRFPQKATLKRHMVRCNLDGASSKRQLYKCKDCDKEYVNRYLLFEHSKEHTGLPWICAICEKKFTKRSSVRVHINGVHKLRGKVAVNKFIYKISAAGELEPLQSQASREHSNAECDTEQALLFTTNTPTHEYIKTELILEDEFLDHENHSEKASSFLKDNHCVIETPGDQEAIDSITGKDSVTCEVCHNIYPKELIEAHISETHRKEIYQCDLCPRSFEEKWFLTRHRKTHNDNRVRNYSCDQCGFQFLLKDTLEKHMITHAKNRKRTACNLCERSFYSRSGLLLHMRTHTGNTHNCERCGIGFPLKTTLQKHMIRCQSGEKPSTSQLYKCTDCDKEYVNRYLLSKHIKEHTGLPWKCAICEKKFTARTRVRAHINGVHRIRALDAVKKLILKVPTAKEVLKEMQPLRSNTTKVEHSNTEAGAYGALEISPHLQRESDVCGNIETAVIFKEEFIDFTGNSGVTSNVQANQRVLEITEDQQTWVGTAVQSETCESSHRPKEFIETHMSGTNCKGERELCTRSFESKESLTLHSSILHDNHPIKYACEQCGCEFGYKRSLETHMLTHIIGRNLKFACSLCERRFRSHRNLERHMRLHSGELHKCEVCGSCFAGKRELTAHVLRRHTGDTPAKCKLCENEHVCNHQSLRYSCELCQRTYASKFTLAAHRKQHTGKPWKCRICGKTFSITSRLRTHITHVHKITDKEAAHELIQKIPTAKDL